jgi:uncharacterized membrane protein YphA (DoxX/SURF4 family)
VFPGGRTGFGLLLLRTALGGGVLVQGLGDLTGASDPTAGTWIADLVAIAAGMSLLIGLLTPISAGLVGVIATARCASILPAPNAHPFASIPSIALLAVIATAVVLVGPGAFSLDARLFGLREIIIPSSRSEKSDD